jgi:ketosteroid isomerase-like protein
VPHSGTLTLPVSVVETWRADPSAGHVEIVAAAIDAFNQRDFGAWEALSLADVEVDWSASRGLEAGVYRGRAEVDRFLRTFETFKSVVVEPEWLIDAGDSVIVTNSARFRGRAGIETVARSTVGYELHGGRIARVCLYQETADALEAAGLRSRSASAFA